MNKCPDCESETLIETDSSENYKHDITQWNEFECQDCGCMFFVDIENKIKETTK